VFANIVVGTDGSATAGLAVALAGDLAKQHGAVLHIVNAYKVPPASVAAGFAGPVTIGGEDMSSGVLMEESQKLLEAAAKSVGQVKVETHSDLGSPVDVVLAVAQALGADLIVVGSKGMRGARRMIGSVPNSIAHRAPCHVLIAKTA
jgi:nucleotide-binding universal stress UspA family protein